MARVASDPEEARLETLLGYHILDTPPEAVFDDLVGLAALIAQAPMAVMSLVDRDRLWFKASLGVPQREMPRSGSFCEASIRNPPLFVVPDALADERFRDNPMVAAGVRFYAGAPLVVAQRHAIGCLSVLDTRARDMSPAQRDGLIVLARAAADHLELRREVLAQRRRDRVMISLLEDIADAKADLQAANTGLERRITERTGQMQAALKELEGFAFNVAHNLRAPLRALNAASQAFLRERAGALTPSSDDNLRRIASASVRMDHMISDLLAYYRLPLRAFTLEPVDVSAAWKLVLRDMAGEISGARADVAVEEVLPRVLSSEPALRQVLANLLSNALKFTAAGERPFVRAGAEERGDWVRLWVQDRGIGIAERHQERIFLVFERLNRMEDYPGNGIGLAIVRKAVERMGGRAGVESSPGQGSRFWVELRRVSSSPSAEAGP